MADVSETGKPWGATGPSGEWSVEGSTAQGEKYTGKLDLERSGSIFLAQWTSETLGCRPGTGILYGESLLLARNRGASTRPGIVWYVLASNGDLEAVWNSVTLGGAVSTGRATGGEPGVIPGRRAITYYNLDGNPLVPPFLNLDVSQEGTVYTLRWNDRNDGTTRFFGVGLAVTNGVASAWDVVPGDSSELELDLLVFTPKAGGDGREAEATWASTTGSGSGVESIRRLDPREPGLPGTRRPGPGSPGPGDLNYSPPPRRPAASRSRRKEGR